MRRRPLFVAAMVVGLAVATTPVASAAAPPDHPFHGTWGFSGTMDAGLPCSGPVSVSAVASFSWTDLFLKDGTVREVGHAIEQDTFFTDTKTLVGNPYVWNYTQWYADATFTEVLSMVGSGTLLSATLPEGTLLLSTGRVNMMASPGPWWTPDSGHAADLGALCAYFYP